MASRAAPLALKERAHRYFSRRVRDAIEQGIYLAPEDRKRSGLFLDFSIVKNITLPDLYRFATALLLDGRREHDAAETQSVRLVIKAPNVDTLAGALSGGNQQKIVLGKWLSMRPKVMIFDEPTRGIDVGAKTEIYTIMRELADAGVAPVAKSAPTRRRRPASYGFKR